MKMLLGAVAAATLLTSSTFTFAQSYTPDYGTGNISTALQARLSPSPASAYAQASGYPHLGAPHISGNAVYVDGRVVGQDANPNIRLQLLRDPPGLSQ